MGRTVRKSGAGEVLAVGVVANDVSGAAVIARVPSEVAKRVGGVVTVRVGQIAFFVGFAGHEGRVEGRGGDEGSNKSGRKLRRVSAWARMSVN